jgi:hypothetical protein
MHFALKENPRLKYESFLLHKEFENQTDEREYSEKDAEILHTQNLENAKMVSKLETECQRLPEAKKGPCPADIMYDIAGQGPVYRGSPSTSCYSSVRVPRKLECLKSAYKKLNY